MDHLPVDDSVAVPPSVKRAAAAAEALHKQAYPIETPPVDPPVAAPVNPPVDISAPPVNPPVAAPPVAAPVTAAVTPPVSAPVETPPVVENWEHRYHSMKGRFDQSTATIGAMQQQMNELGDELVRMQGVLAQRGVTPNVKPTETLTDEERKTYGEDLINVVKKAAHEEVAPQLSALHEQSQRLQQRLARQAQSSLMADLTAAVPNWEAIKNDPRFHAWLRLPDLYSGVVRVNLLKQSYQAANAPRVIAFYKGFISDEEATGQSLPGQQPAAATPAPRVAAVDLVTLAAPGTARPATGLPAEKPTYTRKNIAQNFDMHRRGAWAGRDAEWASLEADMIAAGREGRIR